MSSIKNRNFLINKLILTARNSRLDYVSYDWLLPGLSSYFSSMLGIQMHLSLAKKSDFKFSLALMHVVSLNKFAEHFQKMFYKVVVISFFWNCLNSNMNDLANDEMCWLVADLPYYYHLKWLSLELSKRPLTIIVIILYPSNFLMTSKSIFFFQ
jgi:hypothetical protein